MSHTYIHAENSASIFGGKPEDYLKIHDWLDATKETFADFRHRALRHHSQGIFEAERVFGHIIENSVGKKVPVRYVCEQHIMEGLWWLHSHRLGLVPQHPARRLDVARIPDRRRELGCSRSGAAGNLLEVATRMA